MRLKHWYFYLWNFWPPFWGAGIVIDKITPDFRYVRMRLKRRPWTRNLVGTQFGGSIYAMTDPIYMTLFVVNLGRDYIVWDKAATIRFRQPGRSDLFAEFALDDTDIAAVKQRLAHEPKMDWHKTVRVVNPQGELIAEIEKTIHIRRK